MNVPATVKARKARLLQQPRPIFSQFVFGKSSKINGKSKIEVRCVVRHRPKRSPVNQDGRFLNKLHKKLATKAKFRA